MRITLLSVLCFAGAASLPAQVPVMHQVSPDSGSIGSVLKIQGDFLDKTKVDEVYLTDHTFDMKVKVLAQTEDSIEFRVPPFVKPGRLQLLVKTAGKEPMLLEQPVYITVEEANAKDVNAKDVNAKDVNTKEEPKPKETLQANADTPASPAPPPANATK